LHERIINRELPDKNLATTSVTKSAVL